MLHSIACLCLTLLFANVIAAQAPPILSVQGLLKKANGNAVDDGPKTLTFRLYPDATTLDSVWTEEQTLDISNGIYSADLGASTPLTIPFDVDYYLGITVTGSTELKPRTRLTTSPYALALRGMENKFPSSGNAIAGGYALYNSDPAESTGVFSSEVNSVSLYANNIEIVKVSDNMVSIGNNASISYGTGKNDWRLVEADYFETDAEGWKDYAPTPDDDPGGNAWKNPSGSSASVKNYGAFAGKVLLPADDDNVLKKKFDLSGAGNYTYIKIVFNYYIIGDWKGGNSSAQGWGAFAKEENGTSIRVGWNCNESQIGIGVTRMEDLDFQDEANFSNAGKASAADSWLVGEMVGWYPSSEGPFYVLFGYNNVDTQSNYSETYAIGHIEVWVK